MKTIKKFLVALFAIGLGVTASAQTHDHMNMNMVSLKSDTLIVMGNCGMCKVRIENAAKAEGATSANWNAESKLLVVSFDSEKTNIDAIGKKIAAVGHDNNKNRASDEIYARLPGCCKYEREQ